MGRVLYVFIALLVCGSQVGAQNADAAKSDTVKRKKGQSFEELKRDLAKGNPLYLLNGWDIKDSLSKENFNKLKSEDMTSIDVFRDTSATNIWGKRGAGGVVVVHTKDEAKNMETMMREQVDMKLGAPPAHSMAGSVSDIKTKSPLYVVDGKPLPYNVPESEEKALKSIDPNSVFSVSVLKDAKAKALYGVRGVNGAVIITTIASAVKQYQAKLARFSRSYGDYLKSNRHDESTIQYVLDGKQLTGEKIEITQILYDLPVKEIKTVTFRNLNKPAGNTAPTLTINTK